MRRRLAMLCFFLSGAAGLIDEIVWIKRSALVFGSTTFALSTVLAVFFGGLAVGSEVFGRIGARLRRPVALYARLEFALAALALLSLPAFRLLDSIYGALYRALADGAADATGSPVLIAARVLLVAVVLLPPAIAMGGTLPLFVRQFAVSRDDLSGQVGLMYGVNTLGAAVGTVAAGFWLLPALGLAGSLGVAATLNVTAGVIALRLRLDRGEAPVDAVSADAPTGRISHRLRFVSALFFLTGAAALAAEVVWSRFLSLMVRNSVTTYTLTLAVVLTGIVLGSLLAARIWDRSRSLASLFATLQAAGGLIVLVLTGLPADLWLGLGQGVWPYAVLMLPPAVLSGASFPLAVRLATDSGDDSTRSVGRLTALNTCGGIVGSLAAGFWLVPALGVAAALRVTTGLAVAAAVLALALLDRPRGRRYGPRLGWAALAVAAWILVPRLTPAHLPDDYLARSGHVIDAAEGYGSTLAVVRRDGDLQLLIDRLWQGKNRKSHQIVAAHVPALLHPGPERVLVVGLGVGQTASRFLMYGVEALDCVDIEPAIFPFVREHFDSAWMDDPRVSLVPDDGRSFVAHTARTYDVVSVEVGQVFRPGVDAFYTREFYEQAVARLRPGGLIAQFVPLSFLDEPRFRRILATFLDACPEAVLWYNTSELLLVGSPDAPVRLDRRRLETALAAPALADDLEWSHWGGVAYRLNRPERFAGGFLCGTEQLHVLAADAALYTDARPELAYAAERLGNRGDAFDGLVDLIAAHLSSFTNLWTDGPTAHDAEATRTRALHLRSLKADRVVEDLRRISGEEGGPAALRAVERAVNLNPHSVTALRAKGDLLDLAGRFVEAEAAFRSAAAMDPDDLFVRRGLALVLVRTPGTRAEAERLLRGILAETPDDAVAHRYLGACLADTGRLREAVGHFRRAVMLDPGDEEAAAYLRRAEADLRR